MDQPLSNTEIRFRNFSIVMTKKSRQICVRSVDSLEKGGIKVKMYKLRNLDQTC